MRNFDRAIRRKCKKLEDKFRVPILNCYWYQIELIPGTNRGYRRAIGALPEIVAVLSKVLKASAAENTVTIKLYNPLKRRAGIAPNWYDDETADKVIEVKPSHWK